MEQTPPVLPLKVRAVEMVPGRWRCSGRLPVVKLVRVAKICTDDVSGIVLSVNLHLDASDAGVDVLCGHISGQLPLQCQRCLGVYNWRFDLSVAAGLVHGPAEAQRLMDDLEPCELPDDGWLQLHAFVADELLLAMPLVPRHAAGECSAPGGFGEPAVNQVK